MKTLLSSTLIVLFTCATFAQEHRAYRGKNAKGTFKDFTPEQIATLKTKKMVLALDLSDGQYQKMLALNTEVAKKMKEKRADMKAHKESGKKLSSQEKYDLMIKRLDARIAFEKKVKSILNEEQFTKWKKMMHHRKKGMKQKMQKRKHKKQH